MPDKHGFYPIFMLLF